MTNQDYEKIIWITPSLKNFFKNKWFKEFYKKNLGSDAIFANYAKIEMVFNGQHFCTKFDP